jgi:hypothetical protein
MKKFTVTITIKDRDEGEGVNISAKINPVPTDDESESSEALIVLQNIMESLNDNGEVESAKAKLMLNGECLHEQDLMGEA